MEIISLSIFVLTAAVDDQTIPSIGRRECSGPCSAAAHIQLAPLGVPATAQSPRSAPFEGPPWVVAAIALVATSVGTVSAAGEKPRCLPAHRHTAVEG